MPTPQSSPSKTTQKVLSRKTWKRIAVSLRLLAVLQILSGVSMIVLAIVLQWPPGDALTLGLWIIGGFTIVAAVFGFIGSARVRCCLGLHAVLSVIAGLGHLGLVIYLFVDPAGAVQKLQDYAIDKGHAPRSSLEKAVSIGRWVLLGLLSLQAIAVIFALVVRRVLRRRAYEEFKDVEAPSQQDRRAQREADMQDLREKIATVAAANRAELMGAEDGNLAAVDPRTSAVAPQAGGAPAPLSRPISAWTSEQHAEPRPPNFKPSWTRSAAAAAAQTE
ncbi:hypothetical protein F751_0879 [Auxenochlorella protothecoides]|uniref:Uncharacterized protein n=1 Tax=Auxenochlorella protothecoides TaxID=3075 RepID=A0A087SHY7_AUXPR|nr:hypothetical protein F751_0879 [Auxenochlorella protothecoides]KFM25341.1 hypothetical protein F751_0879 [Auxenochlorella protothecoides]